MMASTLTAAVAILLLQCSVSVYGQDDFKWVDDMDALEVSEAIGQNVFVYQLLATYRDSPDGIEYGFNNKITQPDDNTIDQLGNRFQIFRNGTVTTINAEIDFENVADKQIRVQLIARLIANPDIFIKRESGIVVTNENDESPQFRNDSLTAFIEENMAVPPGGLKIKENIYIEDPDGILNGLQFLRAYVQSCQTGKVVEDCTDRFALINKDFNDKSFMGDFYVLKALDFERGSTIAVELQATDGLHVVYNDIVVTVLDVQDSGPEWTIFSFRLQHDDGTPAFEVIGTVEAVDTDTVDIREIFYTLEPGTVDIYSVLDYFEIGNRSGIIRNKVPLDLESKPFRDANQLLSIWPLTIKACEIIEENPAENKLVIGTSMVNECILGITNVDIRDINDNRPLFSEKTYIYELREDVQLGEHLTDPQIFIGDADTELNNKFTVSFDSSRGEFAVIGSSLNPTIRVERPDLIDYETGPREYNLVLIAEDIGDTTLTDRANVIIHIIDVNDNVPIFTYPIGQNYYEEWVWENASGGTNVLRALATDLDSGIFGNQGIRYKLQGLSTHSNLFDIDPETGQVTVANCDTPGIAPCLDHETTPNRYNLVIVATDTKGDTINGLTERATLIINLLDYNDNAPVCDRLYSVRIDEGKNITTPDLFIEANDADKGLNVQLDYDLLYQPPGDFWQLVIKDNKAHITATKNIAFRDAPNDGMFNLEILVTDGDYTDICLAEIIVLDKNDNAPYFLPNYYEISISEATLGDVGVVNVTAFDDDDPTSANGQIYYRIIRGSLGKFRFKPSTDDSMGQLYTIRGAGFDFDLTRRYNLTVSATDRGTPTQVGYATVIINILDANNKDPAFIPDRQTFTIYDNEPVGNTVYTLIAQDPDVDAKLTYEFIEPIDAYSPGGSPVDRNLYSYTDLFAVDPSSGGVIVNKQLDSERVSTLTYKVLVRDITPPLQTGIGTLMIYIRHYNVIPPRFEDIPSRITIPEEPVEGSFIMNVIAVDDDGSIKWNKITSQGDDLFEIGSRSGVVMFKSNRRVDYDDERRTNSSYFVVQVADTGNPILYAETRIDVYFTNINDIYPRFVSAAGVPKETYYSDIKENSPDGTPVVTVYATDADRPDEKGYADVSFSMDDDRFDVDPLTGEVYVRLRNGAELDRELTPEISVAVRAYDTPNGPIKVRKERVASIAIQLLDVNDNPSEFSKDVYYVTIYETIVVTTDILQLFTSDADSGINAIAFFYKVPGVGNDTNNFGVRNETGHVFIQQSLIGKTDMFYLQVMAIDELGKGPFKRTADIYITVKEAANKGPEFIIPARENMTITVLEEQYLGMLVYDVKAVDYDSGTNGVIDYSFFHEGVQRTSTGTFRINSVTGVITAGILYDREAVDRYVLLLQAKDRGKTPLATTRFLTVVILDVNDNKPTFAVNEIEFRVSENRTQGSNIGKVEATDPDLDPVINYQIISGNEDGVFSLQSTTTGGYLSLARPLDREVKDIYYLDILATNDEPDYTVIRNRRRRAIDPSIITVKVLVGDINDLAPVFLQEPYYGCVSTRSSLMTNILSVQAIDRDAVGTGIVRYSITGGNVDNDVTLFDINDKFGFITNQVLMRDYVDRTFTLTVNARDGIDVATSESANTEAKIFVTQPGKEAKLLITQNTAEVRLYQTQIQRIIEKTRDIDLVCITDIQDHLVDSIGSVTTLWSDVFFSAMKDGKILSSTQLVNIVNRDRLDETSKSDFDLLYIKEVEAASSTEEIDIDDTTVLVVLVIIAILVFLVIIFCILAFMCIHSAKQHKKQRLIQKSYAVPGPLPVPEPMVVQPIVEPIIYDNRTFVGGDQPDTRAPQSFPPQHVEYAVVQKSERVVDTEQVVDDTQIIVDVPRESPVPATDVYQPQHEEEEYRIVTETM